MALPTNIKYGIVTGTFIKVTADTSDADREPQATPVAGIQIKFTPDSPTPIITDAIDGVTVFLEPVYGITNAAGVLVPADPTNPAIVDPTQVAVVGIPLLAPGSSSVDPDDWTWTATITPPGLGSYSFSFYLTAAGGTLANLVPRSPSPGTDVAAWTAVVSTVQGALASTIVARDAAIAAAAAGGGGAVDSVNGQVGVVSLTAANVGAAAASHTHAATGISDSTATGRSLITATNAAAALSAIGGQAAGSYAAATHTHAATGISDSTTVGRAVMTAADALAARTAIGAQASGSYQAAGSYAAATHTHAAVDISDSTTTGRSVITAATALAARTAIGAGTSSLVIGVATGQAPDAAKMYADQIDHVFYNTSLGDWDAPNADYAVHHWHSEYAPGIGEPTGMSGKDVWHRG